MKRVFFPILTVVFVMMVVTSCKKDEEETVSKITMTTAKTDVVTIIIGGSGRCTIDWGDGTSELQTLSSFPSQEYSHSYNGKSSRTITITYKNITLFASGKNQLSGLDVSGCTTLETLHCNDNQLINLDIDGCTALTDLGFYHTQLTNFDVSGCTTLMFLHCVNNFRLTSLNASGCTALIDLECNDNQLTSLDVSGCTRLTGLICSANQLSGLNVTGCTNLKWLICFINQLSSLDMSTCTGLEDLNCDFNQLDADTLDNLFRTLHSDVRNGSKTISICDNPGIDGCNPSIAKNKGWDFFCPEFDNKK